MFRILNRPYICAVTNNKTNKFLSYQIQARVDTFFIEASGKYKYPTNRQRTVQVNLGQCTYKHKTIVTSSNVITILSFQYQAGKSWGQFSNWTGFLVLAPGKRRKRTNMFHQTSSTKPVDDSGFLEK
ncbi:Hypothetical_protein [Hexamita inflata]|uniref:Hypothetical_protein n=1 Tax=Hexamita inflata TaxID=28002 RepID=A0AA86NY79_9EUKA|nr:Hypothetical protein HINF_LOCUS14576 [Hexamita inflata]